MSNKEVVKELVEKLLTIESEINLLQEDRKITLSDYKDRLDIKAFRAALRIAKIKSKLGDSEDALDNILDVVEDRLTVI
jgi:hypothetical protein|tara:strand:- start:4248 stop:4484 length:237 start_codon:yes stop_codon:yes gene_type:complete